MKKVYLRITTGLAEGAFLYYRGGRGVDKPVEWLIGHEEFAPESPAVRDKVRRHP